MMTSTAMLRRGVAGAGVLALGLFVATQVRGLMLPLTQQGTYDTRAGTVTYRLDWKAEGVGTAADMAIADTVPPGTTFVSADSGGILQGNVVMWNLGSRTGGEQGHVSMVVSVDAARALNPWATTVVQADLASSGTGTHASALGVPDQAGVRLGDGGSVVFGFSIPIVNATGTDVVIAALPSHGTARVAASNNLADWVELGEVSGSGEVDLRGLPETFYIKVAALSGGYGLDAVGAVHRVPLSCAIFNQARLAATVDGQAVQSKSDLNTDIHPGCGSAFSGSGTKHSSGAPTPGGNGTTTPGGGGNPGGGAATTTPGSGGTATTTPGGGTSPGSGNGTVVPPTGGESSGTSTGGGSTTGTNPAGQEGGEQPGSVLGTTAMLPRTGMGFTSWVVTLIFIFLFASFIQMFRADHRKI